MARLWRLNVKSFMAILVGLLIAIVVACGSAATPTASPTSTPPPAATSTLAPGASAPTATSAPVPTAAPGDTSEAEMLRAPEPNPKYGGVLQWAGLADAPHFDMHQCNTAACAEPMGPLFDNLLRYSPFDGGREVIPDLAYRWEMDDAGLVYTFHLRDGVLFHDGTQMTSEDVKATFDRIIFPPTGMISPRQGAFDTVTEVRAVDPLTVEFVLSEARAFLPEAIASGWNVIESKAALEANSLDMKRARPGTADHPGTGPFILEEYQAGEFWKLEKNPNYWNPELPYLDGIQFNQLAYGPATGASLIAGRTDYVYGAGGDLRDDIQTRYSDTHTVVVYPIPSIGGLFVNHENDVLDDARVRQAISMVIDRCAIKEAVTAIREIEIGTFIIANDTVYGPDYREETLNKKAGYRCPTPQEDIEAAQDLLAEAGYPNGQGIPTLDMMVRDLNFFVSPMAPQMQAMMRQRLNINTDIRIVHTSVWQEDQLTGNYDLAVNGQPTTLGATPAYWSQWFKTGSGGNWNRGASNPEFDEIVSQLMGESDPVRAAELVQRGVAILEEWNPMVFVNHFTIIDGFANYVKGHGRVDRVTLFDDIRFDTVWLDK